MSWIVFAALVVCVLLFGAFYVKSVSPAALEQRIGSRAYLVCGRYRIVSMIFMLGAIAGYVLYILYPLPLPVPRTFSWPWSVSGTIAGALAVPSAYFVVRGMLDSGREALAPQRDQEMFGGIYRTIRHPQAWEAVFWFVIAFLLHSPFLVGFSLLGVVVEVWMIRAEEKDLVLRFGEAYLRYRQETGSILPRMGRRD